MGYECCIFAGTFIERNKRSSAESQAAAIGVPPLMKRRSGPTNKKRAGCSHAKMTMLEIGSPHELEYVYGRKEKGQSAWKLTDDLFIWQDGGIGRRR